MLLAFDSTLISWYQDFCSGLNLCSTEPLHWQIYFLTYFSFTEICDKDVVKTFEAYLVRVTCKDAY